MEPDRRGRTYPKPWPEWWRRSVTGAMARLKSSEGGKFTQHDLAVAIDRSDEMVSRCITGKVPNIEVMQEISEFLHIPPAIGLVEEARLATSQQSGIHETVRRNAGAFRLEAKFTQGQAADLAEIPVEDYINYEQGAEPFPLTVIELLAVGYRRDPGDFLSAEPPLPRDGLPGLWWRATPEVLEQISPDDRRRLDALIREIDEKSRAAKRDVVEQVQRAKTRRQRR